MRLIDADTIKEQTTKRNSIWDSVSDIYGRGLTEIIDSMPTIDAVPRQKYEEDMENAFAHGYTDAESNFRKMIADGELVKVVRCKDCIHQEKFFHEDKRRNVGGHYIYGCELADGYSHVCLDGDFCSRGERRTDE